MILNLNQSISELKSATMFEKAKLAEQAVQLSASILAAMALQIDAHATAINTLEALQDRGSFYVQ